jgi:hypothetical protein
MAAELLLDAETNIASKELDVLSEADAQIDATHDDVCPRFHHRKAVSGELATLMVRRYSLDETQLEIAISQPTRVHEFDVAHRFR